MYSQIIGLDREEISKLSIMKDEPAYRSTQLARWIYVHNASEFSKMLDLPQDLREKLNKKYKIRNAKIERIQRSSDGTIKLLLKLTDGQEIETVGMPYRKRFSCCISTQVGCPVGCLFCATGWSGYKRNLTAGEIVEQILSLIDIIKSKQIKTKSINHYIDNVVFMGMGEPLLNYHNTLKALRLINNELEIGERHVTISTVGYVPGIFDLSNEKLQVTLAVSLHAPDDELRRLLIPGMKKYSVNEILESCKEYIDKTKRRVTFEYLMIKDINDDVKQARKLAYLLYNLNCHVNVIPFNPVMGIPFSPPSPKTVNSFINELKYAGINVTQRISRGKDIDAACGQLRLRSNNI